jgi:hypothetical protein
LERWIGRAGVGLVVVALLATWGAELRRVRGMLPYPQHVDERPVLNAAARVLKSGDWNPHLYQYPSLPIYVATAGLALGIISASGSRPEQLTVRQVGRLAGGFYEHPEVVRVPRLIWATMGIVTLAALAAIGFQLGGILGLVSTAAALAVGSKLREIASTYINVDTPMCMFTALCMLSLVSAPRRHSTSWWTAVLCGAAMACKYNALVLLVPCLMAIALDGQPRRLVRAVGFIGMASFAFLVCCPYFLLDLRGFVDGLAGVAHHYGVLGHRRFQVEPGWPHLLVIADDVIADYGLISLVFAALGCCFAPGLSPQRKLLLASLPLAAAASMSRYRVHFTRNSLELSLLVPVLAALGARAIWPSLDRAAQWLGRRTRWSTPSRTRVLTAVLAVAAIVLSLPVQKIVASYAPPADPRNQFVAWARRGLAPGSVVLISTQLPMDITALSAMFEVRKVDLRNAEETRAAAIGGAYVLLPHWQTDSAGAQRALSQLSPGLDLLQGRTLVRSFAGTPTRPIEGDDIQCVNPGLDLARLD